MQEPFDIHHVFPKKWCVAKGIEWKVFDSIINKTPLTAKTNRIIGGAAPSSYLTRLTNSIDTDTLDACLRSHSIPVGALRADDFDGFIAGRKEALLVLIEDATGQKVYRGVAEPEPEEEAIAEQEEIVAKPDRRGRRGRKGNTGRGRVGRCARTHWNTYGHTSILGTSDNGETRSALPPAGGDGVGCGATLGPGLLDVE